MIAFLRRYLNWIVLTLCTACQLLFVLSFFVGNVIEVSTEKTSVQISFGSGQNFWLVQRGITPPQLGVRHVFVSSAPRWVDASVDLGDASSFWALRFPVWKIRLFEYASGVLSGGSGTGRFTAITIPYYVIVLVATIVQASLLRSWCRRRKTIAKPGFEVLDIHSSS